MHYQYLHTVLFMFLRCDGVLERRDKLKEDAVQRRNKLQESKSYQEFLGNVYEVVKTLFNHNHS